MPLITLKFVPGINKEVTNYSAKGGWVACDHIRFRQGYPEKIGGYVNWSTQLGSTSTFSGVARTLFPWVTYDVQTLVAIGTNQKYYVVNTANGAFNDITPVASTQTGLSDPFTTVAGSSLVTVTDATHGATAGTFVTITGVPSGGVNGITNLNGQFEILQVIDNNVYTISAYPQTATVTGGTTGITNISASYLISAGNAVETTSTSGWGFGPWGGYADATFTGYISGTQLTTVTVASGALGAGQIVSDSKGLIATGTTVLNNSNPYNLSGNSQTVGSVGSPVAMTSGTTGWGIGAASATGVQLLPTMWSQTNTGQDLVFARSYDKPYYWVKNTNAYPPGVTLAAYSGTQNKTFKPLTVAGVAGQNTITVSDTLSIDTGSIVTGSHIPTGAFVATYWNGSTTIPLSVYVNGIETAANLTANTPLPATMNFSYSQYSVPNQVGMVFSDANGFIIFIGANPYNPTNFNTTYDPMLVRWSDQNNPYDYVPTTFNQAGSNHLQIGSYLVTGKSTRQENLIWTNSALYSMQYVGPPYVYSFTLLADNVSIISQNAAITVNNITYWMGVDKFYVYNGQVQPLPCSLRNFVFKYLNTAQVSQVVCGINIAYNEVWWHYPSAASLVNDTYIVYNYLENSWYYGSMNRSAWLGSELIQSNPLQVIAAGTTPLAVISAQTSYLSAPLAQYATVIPVINGYSYPKTGVVVIDSEQISYTNAEDGLTLNAISRGYNSTAPVAHNQYAPVTLLGDNQIVQHEVGMDDVTSGSIVPIYAYARSADIDLADGERYVYIWRIIPDMTFTFQSPATTSSVTLTVNPRANPGSAYLTGMLQNNTLTMTGTPNGLNDPWGNYTVGTNAPVSTLTTPAPHGLYNYPVEQYTGQVYTRVRGRQFSFQIQSTGANMTWQMGDMRIDARPDGRR